MQDLQETQDRLQAADNSAHAELRKLRQEIETVATDDVSVYADALTSGETPPKARAARIKDRVRDLELRVIPGIDEATWRFVHEVRAVLRPDADESYKRLLDKELPRWQAPATGRRDQPAPPQHLKPRPRDILAWVEAGIGRVDRFFAEAAEKAERDDRKRKATNAVNAAQAAYNGEQRRLLDEREAAMSPTARNAFAVAQAKAQTPPWPDFDRRAWLEANGLLEDYDYVQPGARIQVKGGRSTPVEFVPASDLQPASTEA